MLFNGDKLYMLPSQAFAQSMGFVIAGQNDVIVIDGGTKNEAKQLEKVLTNLGGTVKGWYLTHAHYDHIEALIEILEKNNILIDCVYYNFPSTTYIEETERKRNLIARVADLEKTLKTHHIPTKKTEKGKYINSGHFKILPLSDGHAVKDDINASSVVYRVETNGQPILFLGDMDINAEDIVLKEFPEQLKCPVIQMAHHGQLGVSESFYKHISPKICLWPTPIWLWNNDIGNGFNTGPFKTIETRNWMKKMNTINYYYDGKITVLK